MQGGLPVYMSRASQCIALTVHHLRHSAQEQHTDHQTHLHSTRGSVGRYGGGAAAARAAPPVMRERSQRIFRSSGLGCLWSFEAATGESAADVKYESPAVRDSVASWWDM